MGKSDTGPSVETPTQREIWFPAKRYGWGWGFPTHWKGWVVLVAFLLLTLGTIPLAMVRFPWGLITYLLLTASLSAALVAVCRWKGEPPRWRWGGE